MIFDFGAVSPQITLNGNASLDKGQRGYKIARTGKLGERLIIAKLGDPGGALKLRSRGYPSQVDEMVCNGLASRPKLLWKELE